jgi:hypothetical protein
VIRSALVGWTLLSLSFGVVPGCRAEALPPPELPEYTPEDALLLDDAFSPAVLRGGPAVIDDTWVERVRAARAVVPAMVATVSLDSMTGQSSLLSVTFDVLEPPLAGKLKRDSVQVVVPPASPSYHHVRTRRQAIAGRRLLLFIGWYKSDGDPTPHWHAEPDEPAARAAVARAVASE